MATRARGRDQAKRTQRGRAKRDAPRDYWHKKARPLRLGNEQFRVRIKRGDRKDVIVVDSEITSIEWAEAGGPPTASVTFTHGTRRPVVEIGHLAILEWKPYGGGRWKEVWRMRVSDPESNEESTTVQLEDDFAFLHRSRDKFRYGKSKKRPRGWRLDGVIRDIARRYGVKIGKLARITTRSKKFAVTGTPAEAITKCLLLIRNDTGDRLTLRPSRGKLDIVPLRRSRTLLLLGPAIIDYALRESLDRYASAITVRGSFTDRETETRRDDDDRTTSREKKGRKKKKFRVRVESRAAIRRFGYVHINAQAPKGIDTIEEARRWARRELAKRRRPKQEITLTHVGIPTVRRWDAIQIHLPKEGLDMLAYVSEVRHSVSPGDYRMEIVVRFTDPFVDKKGERIRKKKCEAAAKRRKKHPRGCTQELRRRTRPKPRTARQRGDAKAAA